MSATITGCWRTLNDEATSESETQYFLLEVQEEDATPWEVLNAAYVVPEGDSGGRVSKPGRDSEHPKASFLTAGPMSVKRQEADGKHHKRRWVLKVPYAFNPVAGGFGGGIPTSTVNSKNVTLRVSGIASSVYTMDSKGPDPKAIRNNVGDMYPEPQEVTLYDTAYTISYEKESIDAAAYDNARGKINTDSVSLNIPQGTLVFARTFAAKTLLVAAWDYEATLVKKTTGVGNSATTTTTAVWRCTVTLHYRADKWLRKLPQMGYRWRDVGGKLFELQPDRQYLKANGEKLGPDEPLVRMDPGVQMNDEQALASLLAAI